MTLEKALKLAEDGVAESDLNSWRHKRVETITALSLLAAHIRTLENKQLTHKVQTTEK